MKQSVDLLQLKQCITLTSFKYQYVQESYEVIYLHYLHFINIYTLYMNYVQEVPMYSKTFPNLLKHRIGMAMQWYLFFYLMMLIDSKQN